MFAIIWIIVWAFIFQIFNDPKTVQIWGFIRIGIGGPVVKWVSDIFR